VTKSSLSGRKMKWDLQAPYIQAKGRSGGHGLQKTSKKKRKSGLYFQRKSLERRVFPITTQWKRHFVSAGLTAL